jgi:hypothetical protein
VIEDIRRLMLKLVVEAINKEKLSRMNPSRAAEKQQQKQQQRNGIGG